MRPVWLPPLLLAAASLAGTPGSLILRVGGLREPVGVLRISLFQSPAGYPEDFSLAARTLTLPITDTMLTARFDSLDPGSWAVALLHDRNGNQRLDRNLLGIPKEGIGASNGAAHRWGPPRFGDARFHFRGGADTLRLTLRYWP